MRLGASGGGVRCGGVAVIDCHLAFLWRMERHIVEQLVGYGSLGGGCVDMTPHLLCYCAGQVAGLHAGWLILTVAGVVHLRVLLTQRRK